LARMVDDRSSALAMLDAKIASGEALERFRRMIELQGGDPRVLDDSTLLPAAEIQHTFSAKEDGFLENVSAEEIGRACMVLGAGRNKTSDRIDHAVGVSSLAKVGDAIAAGDPLLILHANDKARLEQALVHVRRAFTSRRNKVSRLPLITNTIVPATT